jgi:chemotaxis protein CheD
MMRPEEQLPLVTLKPGEAYFTNRPERVLTVLGSCLSVTMFNRHRRLAGICHALLPECGRGKVCGGECPEEYRYVDCSIRRMLETFDRHCIPGKEIEVKCFGGSDMFPENISRQGLFSVGKQNIARAEKVIADEGLTILVKDVGGLYARKILFHTHTGEVFLKRLGTAYNPDIIREIP